MDKKEFAVRVDALKGRLYRTAYMFLGSEAKALDAVDEAVYQGLKALGRLREPQFFDTWMTRILINECKKEQRRRKRELPEEYLPEGGVQDYDSLPLKEAVKRLPQEFRDVVVLRFFGGFTLLETAGSLGIPQGTAASRQRRALALLKLELSEEDEA